MEKQEWTEEDLKILAKHLRKPEGEIGEDVAKRMNVGNAPMNLHTLAVLNPQANQTILEIGMGNGFFVKNILELDETIRYHGLDYSTDMVKLAATLNSNYVQENRAIFLEGSVECIPFEKELFDQVFTINTLYFWEDVQKGLNSISKVLKTGGRLILSIRPKDNMVSLPVTKYDFNLFDIDEVVVALENAGYLNIQKTFVTEPLQPNMGMTPERKCVIISAEKS